MLNVHRSHIDAAYQGRGNEVMGWGVGWEGRQVGYLQSLVPALRHMKTEGTVSHRAARTINVKEVGTTTVQSHLRTPQLALSTTVLNRVTKTESGRLAVGTGSKGQCKEICSFSNCAEQSQSPEDQLWNLNQSTVQSNLLFQQLC